MEELEVSLSEALEMFREAPIDMHVPAQERERLIAAVECGNVKL